jgi:uncharacterized membrane protein
MNPKTLVPTTPSDQVQETLGRLLLLLLWAYFVWKYPSLPDTLPTHFNLSGHPDGYSTKQTLVGLPIVCTLVFVLLTILTRYPHLFNYPMRITPDNALRQYTAATRMLRMLKLSVVAMFFIILLYIIQSPPQFSSWVMVACLVLVFAPFVYYLVLLSKKQ